MFPTYETRVARIRTCRSDLMGDGIDVSHMDRRQLSVLVEEYLEYFQMMLGCDATPAEIVRLFAPARTSVPKVV